MAITFVQKGKEMVPTVQGTRIRVLDIGIESEYLGRSPDDIVRAHPDLTLVQVHEALAQEGIVFPSVQKNTIFLAPSLSSKIRYFWDPRNL